MALTTDFFRSFLVEFDEGFPVSRNVRVNKDRRYGAFWLTKPTVDALIRVNINHIIAFIDAIHRTNGHAGLILNTNARLCYDVGQLDRLLEMRSFDSIGAGIPSD